MPTNKKQFSLVVDDDLKQMIDDYQFEHRIKSRAAAINELIGRGIVELQKQKGADPKPTPLDSYSIQRDPVAALTQVFSAAGLLDADGDISDSDLEFFRALFALVKAHFNKG